MKDLSKKTKEELINLIKELEGKEETSSMEELKEIKDMLNKLVNKEEEEKRELPSDTLEKVKKLVDGATCIIYATDKGILNIGYGLDIMNLLSALASRLKEKMPKEEIEFAVSTGLCDSKEDALKNLLEAIIKMGE